MNPHTLLPTQSRIQSRIQARIHGGTDALGAARFDFSSNSNACGPCPVALAAVQAADASRYPDAQYTQLRQRLADFHAVAAWRIVLAASASEFIFRITAWLARAGGRSVWLPQPAYADYGHAAQAWGLLPSAAVEQADLAWACEPSSPLGQAQPTWPQGVPALPETQPGSAKPALPCRVLDCAYLPMRLSGVASLSAAQQDPLWRLFSPNKALGLTGVRAAYAIAPLHAQPAAQQLEALAPSWPIGTHGQAMLLAWPQAAAQNWLADSLPTLAQWKAQQVSQLQLRGWQCLPSDSHFFCTRPPAGLHLPTLLAHLRQHGIQLRDTTSMGLPGHLRLSAQPPAAQAALLEHLDSREVRA